MPDTPLNPDALRRAADAVSELYADGHCPKAEDAAEVAVSAYLAAALPEVTSVEELEALPIGSVILPLAYHTTVAVALRDQYGTWAVAGHPGDYSTEAIFLGMHGQPARVLHRPEVKP